MFSYGILCYGPFFFSAAFLIFLDLVGVVIWFFFDWGKWFEQAKLLLSGLQSGLRSLFAWGVVLLMPSLVLR